MSFPRAMWLIWASLGLLTGGGLRRAGPRAAGGAGSGGGIFARDSHIGDGRRSRFAGPADPRLGRRRFDGFSGGGKRQRRRLDPIADDAEFTFRSQGRRRAAPI